MAGGHPQMWDKGNQEEQAIVLHTKYKEILDKKRGDLTQVLDPSPMLPYLRQYMVIERIDEENFKFNATRSALVERLLDHLERNPSWKLHGFLRVCSLTGQEHVINLLGLNPKMYDINEIPAANQSCQVRKKVHYYCHAESDERLEIPMDLMNAVLQQCESYNRNLMQTTLFGFKKAKRIDMTDLYVCADATYEPHERDMKKITKKQLFKCLLSTRAPRTVLAEGPPGAGKTTYLREYVHSWSKDVLSCHEKGPEELCQGHEWKFIVYVPAGSIKGSVQDAIRDNLKCERSLRDQTMAWIEGDGEGVLIIHDAVDELHCEEARVSLPEYTLFCKEITTSPKVLISARNALCHIPSESFDRCINIGGFTKEQGIEFVERYYKERYGLTDHPILQHTRENKEKLDVVLCNPLRTHIFSELTAKGSLTLEDVKTLTPIKLLKCLEGHIVRREGEHHSQGTLESQAGAFYHLCLQGLLSDRRQFHEDQIDERSQYQAFLVKQTDIDDDGRDTTSYVFPHEIIFEYFAVRGLIQSLENNPCEKEAVLLYLCSNQSMHNILQLTSGFICQYKPELTGDLVRIIRACLILQVDGNSYFSEQEAKDLLQLPTEIKQMSLKDAFQRESSAEESRAIIKIWKQINIGFCENAEKLKEASWFTNLYHDQEHWRSHVLPFITKCLHQGTTEQQKELWSKTTNCLLPWKRCDSLEENYAWPVDIGRWVMARGYTKFVTATEGNNYNGAPYFIEVTAWCPSDAKEVLCQMSPTNRRRLVHVQINLDCTELWGKCPPDLMSRSACDSLLKHVLLDGVTSITIYTDPERPLSTLLGSLDEALKPRKHGARITLWGGTIELAVLQQWFTRREQKGLFVNLCYMTIVLPQESDVDSVKGNSKLNIIEPRCVTQTGVEVLWVEDFEDEFSDDEHEYGEVEDTPMDSSNKTSAKGKSTLPSEFEDEPMDSSNETSGKGKCILL